MKVKLSKHLRKSPSYTKKGPGRRHNYVTTAEFARRKANLDKRKNV